MVFAAHDALLRLQAVKICIAGARDKQRRGKSSEPRNGSIDYLNLLPEIPQNPAKPAATSSSAMNGTNVPSLAGQEEGGTILIRF